MSPVTAILYSSLLTARGEEGTWFNRQVVLDQLLPSIAETLVMVFFSTAITVILGLPLGVILAETRKDGLIPNKLAHKIIGATVNIGRAIPFIILAVIVLYAIRFISIPGLSTVGWPAFTIALVVSAVPYFARLIESNVLAVEHGKVEAAQMAGASARQIMTGILVREALPAIFQSITILTITIIGYSAMSSIVGGGGLGALAINQGYIRHHFDVVIIAVIAILIIVQIVQWIGDMLSRSVDHR
ncbi:methionine ABC transporter permease [Arcanobacterium pinnipediorum]|uniref:ABC transporter permease subunit n=1 Tax=Arcanobacterium pinnipediorum TaxID=1503041 RepID=A0ABY5AEX8_9ACTO|nr:ABC transporter permease subunit [Arcanobacterium pinnipediorum]USR78767.1 ABC transporter permease subunit [Arcanobacterium pinnipediorum]